VAFDSAFLRSIGWRTGLTDALLMGLICVCTVAGLPAVGVVMMAALLVIPAVTARMWSDRLETVVALSGLFGCASAVGGALVSAGVTAGRGVPTGPMIVLLCAGVFVVSLFVSPGRGVLAVAWRRSRARREAHGPSGRAPRGGGA
jgi:manganese/zinc/iron transport system permease protein